MDLQIIHVLLGKANPERMNGVNKVVNSLATYQTELGYATTVWGITKNPVVNYPERNYNTVLFSDPGKFKLDPRLYTAIDQLPSHSVVHIHGGFIPQFHLVARYLQRKKVPYIYTPHGAYNTVALERSAVKKKIYLTLFERSIVRHAKYLHFIGQSEITGAQKIFRHFRHVLVPNGQNEEELTFQFESLKRPEQLIFGFVGRIDIRTKGLDILCEGFAQYLKAAVSEAYLWIVGDGAERAVLEQKVAELGIEDRVKFWGSQYGSDKNNLIVNMNYLCLTSRNEGLPGVVLEAACLGVPCIVSKTTNMGDYITTYKAGFCLPQNTPKALAKTLHQADKKYQKRDTTMMANAKKMVKQAFNWKHIAQQLINAYEA